MHLHREAQQHQKNREAEESYVRQKVWGADESAGDDVNTQNFMGDVTISQSPQQKSLAPLLLAAALAGGVPAAGVGAAAAYFSNRPTQTTAPDFTDSTVSIGLGRLEATPDD